VTADLNNKTNRRKLVGLCVGFFSYLLLMVYMFRFVGTIRYQALVLCGILNMAIVGTFFFAILKEYRGTPGQTYQDTGEMREIGDKSTLEADRRRLPWLWAGAGLYAVIFLSGLRLGLSSVGKVPLPGIILGQIVNVVILATFLITIRKTYKRIRGGTQTPP
jgi:uncharacterized membrane protein